MRKLLPLILFFVLILLVEVCSAQKVEVSAGISGNLFNYGGTAAGTDAAAFNRVVLSKKLTGGYGANLQVKLIFKNGFMLGLQSGYDLLRSTAQIRSLIIFDYSTSLLLPGGPTYPSTDNYGYSTNTTKLINVNPFLGYRIGKKKLAVDLMLGAEIGFVAEDKSRTVYTYYYASDYSYYYDRSKDYAINYSKTDVRIKTGVSFSYTHYGIDLNYAHGINNLVKVKDGYPSYYSPGSAYSQVLRLGLNYKL